MRYALAAASLLLCSAVFVSPSGPAKAGRLVRVKADAEDVRQEGKKAAPEKKKELGPEPKGPGEAAAVALVDLEKIAAADKLLPKDHVVKYGPDAPFMRYFWVSTAAKDRDDFLAAFCVHLNLLSREGVIRWPVAIAPDVLRIDVRDYGWDRGKLAVWEKTAALDFVFHQKAKLERDAVIDQHWPGGASASGKEFERGVYEQNKKAGDVIDVPAVWLPQNATDGLRKLTYSESPVLMAEWFFVQSARQVSLRNKQEGLGYYDFLGLQTRDDFFSLTGTDPDVAKRVLAHWRAVVTKSGISQQGRQVVALGSHARRVWGTLDTFTQQAKGVPQRNLREGEFSHDAEEWYGFLPNGLWVTFLSNNKGEAAESAPDKIGPDDSPLNRGRDHRVHANLSCVRCHSADKDMLRPIDDWVRRTFRKGGPLSLTDPDKRTAQELESQYLRDLEELIGDDRALYARWVKRATTSAAHPEGLTALAVGKLYAEAWSRYADEDVSLEDAARELGCEPKKLADGIRRHAQAPNRGATDLVLSSFIDNPPQKLRRLDWEDSYQLAMTLSLGVAPAELPKDVKVAPEFDKKKGK